MVSLIMLIACLKMEDIVKWRGLKLQGQLYEEDTFTLNNGKVC